MARQSDTFKDVDIRKLPQYCTPIGIAKQCFLTKPSTEYDPDGQYFVKIKLEADDPATKKLLRIIDKASEEAFATAQERAETPKDRKALKRAEPSYSMEEDDNGVETGCVLINFKRKAARTTKDGEKKPIRLPLFDAGQALLDPDEIDLWGGSEVVIAFKLVPFNVGSVGVGVSHRLEAVQVIKAVSGGDNRTAESFGFAKVSGFKGAEAIPDDDDGEGDFGNTSVDEEDGDY